MKVCPAIHLFPNKNKKKIEEIQTALTHDKLRNNFSTVTFELHASQL